MGYLGSGQSERTKAGDSTFTNGPLELASKTPAGLLPPTTYYTRDDDGTLIGQRSPQGNNYYLFDRLGSVVALTDPAGNALNRYVYDPYGNPLAGTTEAVANPWQFAGGFKDSFSGFYKFGERYYDPVVGRWTQPRASTLTAISTLVETRPTLVIPRAFVWAGIPFLHGSVSAGQALRRPRYSIQCRVRSGWAEVLSQHSSPQRLGRSSPLVVTAGTVEITRGTLSLNKAVQAVSRSDKWVSGCTLRENATSFFRQVYLDFVGGQS